MSRIAISPERDNERWRPRGSTIVGMWRNSIVPSTGASRLDCSLSCAAPPMWKVLIVNCVPGSPIDWAAITPTAPPVLPGVPREERAQRERRVGAGVGLEDDGVRGHVGETAGQISRVGLLERRVRQAL